MTHDVHGIIVETFQEHGNMTAAADAGRRHSFVAAAAADHLSAEALFI